MNVKILLVDDNKDLLQIAQLILKAQGYETILALSIEEAARKIKIHRPVLILLDMSICEAEDGRLYCLKLRREAATKNIRVILMSGGEYSSASLTGADDFLQKPFDVSELIDKVETQLNAAHEATV